MLLLVFTRDAHNKSLMPTILANSGSETPSTLDSSRLVA